MYGFVPFSFLAPKIVRQLSHKESLPPLFPPPFPPKRKQSPDAPRNDDSSPRWSDDLHLLRCFGPTAAPVPAGCCRPPPPPPPPPRPPPSPPCAAPGAGAGAAPGGWRLGALGLLRCGCGGGQSLSSPPLHPRPGRSPRRRPLRSERRRRTTRRNWRWPLRPGPGPGPPSRSRGEGRRRRRDRGHGRERDE